MVALVLSVVLIAGVLQVYMGTSRNYRALESAAMMMESGRTALELLSRELRLANYWKCIGWEAESLSNDLPSNQRGLFGTNGANGAPDALRTMHAVDESAVDVMAIVTLTDVDTVTIPPTVTHNPITVSDGSGFAANDVIIINDCAKGDVFEITGVNADTLSHTCEACAETFGADAHVLRVADTQFFIANNDRGEPSLQRIVDGGAAEELLEGVESMQLFFGEDTDGDGFANRYVTADVIDAPCADGTNPGCWNRVTSTRISLLLRTLEEDVTLGPQTYNFNGATVTATDGRLRRVFTTVVAMRNHLE